METGIDFSFASITAAEIKQAGYSFVCRYLASSPGKAITAAQANDYRSNNLGIVLVFEDYANQALDGYNQGVADAKEAVAQADAIGFPNDRPIYFAVDFDEADTPLTNGEIYAYLDGAASVIGLQRVGVYGGYYVVKRCIENGHATWSWQTVAWSGGQVYAGAHLYQNGNSDFNGGADINQALKTDFGQWGQKKEVNMYPTEAACQILTAQTGWQKGPDGKTSADAIAYWTTGTGNPDWGNPDVIAAKWAIEVFYAGRQEGEDIANSQKPTPAPTPAPDPTPAPTPSPTPPSKLPGWLQAIVNLFTGKK